MGVRGESGAGVGVGVSSGVPGVVGAGTDDEDAAGEVVAALKDGWNAFSDTATGLLQGFGAVLPFGVVLAAIGVPVALAWRRRRSLT